MGLVWACCCSGVPLWAQNGVCLAGSEIAGMGSGPYGQMSEWPFVCEDEASGAQPADCDCGLQPSSPGCAGERAVRAEQLSAVATRVSAAESDSVLPARKRQGMDEMWGTDRQRSGNRQSADRGHLFEWGNYAMFIHWGLYSQLGNRWHGKTYYGIGEWMMNEGMAGADPKEYMATASTFNPEHFDADAVARLAKEAGMKYIVITSKHHDGFAMYDSKCNPFNIVKATPFGRDPMKELAEACRKHGLGFGFYYSHNQDWTAPGGSGGPTVDEDGNARTFDDYFRDKCLPQVEEITRNYGDIELIWFDTPGGMPEKYARQLVEVVRRNQPGALVSGRVGYGLGDYLTLGDMEVPLENIDGLWESVDVTNDAWGYAWYDQNWKSPQQILKNLVSTVARGGTYMMNVGPDGKGDIPEFAAASLRASGRWLKRYPQVVYGASPSPWGHALPWGDVTRQGNRLYLCVYEWPRSGKLFLPGLQTPVRKAALLKGDKRKRLHCTQEAGWTCLSLPEHPDETLVSVIELQLDGDDIRVETVQGLDPEWGLQELSVKFAEARGCRVRKASWMEKFGEWKHRYCTDNLHEGGRLVFTVDVNRPGTYQLEVTARGEGRKVWRVETDEGKMVQNQQGVASLFCNRPLGWIRFDSPGRHTLTVTQPEGGAADLASVSLTPVTME